jgi:hypothetical protein
VSVVGDDSRGSHTQSSPIDFPPPNLVLGIPTHPLCWNLDLWCGVGDNTQI